MNIEYANTIPMRLVLDKIGLEPKLQTETTLLYVSPFNAEEHPSLKLHLRTNHWRDTCTGIGGNLIRFLCLYLEQQGQPCHVKDVLNWLRHHIGYVVLNSPEQTPDFTPADRMYKYKDHGFVTSSSLINYLEKERGIPLDYARFLLREVRLLNTKTGKTFSALGMANDEGGIAIRNPYLKANVRPLYTSFIRGQKVKPDGIHIFKDCFDFLSILAQRQGKPFDNDVLILNHLSMMKLSSAFIRGYGYKYAYTWLDNDSLGKEATKLYASFFRTEPCLKHRPMNYLYQGYKDVNDWHVAKSGSR